MPGILMAMMMISSFLLIIIITPNQCKEMCNNKVKSLKNNVCECLVEEK